MKHLKEFFSDRPERSFQRNGVLLHQGEAGTEVLYITDGYIKAYTIADDGDEKMISILGPGDVINLEAAFFANHLHDYYYEALSDGVVRVVEADALEQELKPNQDAIFGLVRYLMTRNDELAQTLDNILQAKSDTKLINYLALLVQRFGTEISGIVTLPFLLSHAQLASMVGTTRETMTVQIRELTKAGILKSNRSAFEINLEKLRERTDV